MLPQTALRESSTCTVYRCVHSLLKPLVESQRHVILLLQSCQCWIHLGAYSVQVHIQLPHQSQELLHTTNKKTGWLCVRDTINCIKLNNTIKDKIVTPHRGCRFNFQNNSNHIRYRLYVAESLLNSFLFLLCWGVQTKKKIFSTASHFDHSLYLDHGSESSCVLSFYRVSIQNDWHYTHSCGEHLLQTDCFQNLS